MLRLRSLFKSYARRAIFHVVLCYLFYLLFALLNMFVCTVLWAYIHLCIVSGGDSCD